MEVKSQMVKTLALATALLLALSAPALASGKNSISFASVSGGSSATVAPTFGSTVSFATQANESNPYVNVQCRQNGNLVYAATRAYWGTYDRTFTLAQPLDSLGWGWTAGGADCTAGLWRFGGGSRLLASMTFSV